MKRTASLLFLFCILFSVGCVELEQEYFLNPDASGKFILKLNVSVPSNIDSAAQKYGIIAEELMAGRIEAELGKYEGVELWRGKSYQFSADRRIFNYSAVAYFRNFNDCFFSVPELDALLRYRFYENSDGQIEIILETIAVDGVPKARRLSASERAQEMVEARIRYAKARLELPRYFGAIKLNHKFHLPANIREYSNFEQVAVNGAELTIDSKKVLAAMDATINDDSWLSDRVKYSADVFGLGWDYGMNKKIFGSKAAARLLLYPSAAAIFDYEAEVLPIVEIVEAPLLEANANDEAGNYYQLPVGIANYKIPINVQLRRAIRYLIDGDFEASIQRYMNIIANNKASDKYLARTYYQLGMSLFDNGFIQQGLDNLNYVIDEFPLETNAALKASEQVVLIESGKAIAKNVEGIEENLLPRLVSTEPGQFSEGVAVETGKIVLRFDKPMKKYQWYYSSFDGCSLPELAGEPEFDEAMQIWTLPIKLAVGRVYAISINDPKAMDSKMGKGFVSDEGVAAKPFVLVFTTVDKKDDPTYIEDEIFDSVDSFLENSFH